MIFYSVQMNPAKAFIQLDRMYAHFGYYLYGTTAYVRISRWALWKKGQHDRQIQLF